MKIPFSLILYFCFLVSGTCLAQSLKIDKDLEQALQTVDSKNIEAHIRYLADDRLRGRLPGTPGYKMAMEYVINQFKAAGVEPAGEDKDYLQVVRLRKAFTNKNAQFALTDKNNKEETLKSGEDFILYPHFENPNVNLEADLVFVGSGISAPELGYDDYAGIDVKNKIVVIR
ncbi:MAG: peptidase M28, partial [Bacteroidota bacterium]|nr:peptidase M28 [Bacteroidota bacterium]